MPFTLFNQAVRGSIYYNVFDANNVPASGQLGPQDSENFPGQAPFKTYVGAGLDDNSTTWEADDIADGTILALGLHSEP